MSKEAYQLAVAYVHYPPHGLKWRAFWRGVRDAMRGRSYRCEWSYVGRGHTSPCRWAYFEGRAVVEGVNAELLYTRCSPGHREDPRRVRQYDERLQAAREARL